MTTESASALHRLGLYWHTVRHLRPGQLVYWPLRRLQRRLPPIPSRQARTASPDRLSRIGACVEAWGPGDASSRVGRAREIVRGRLTLLNRSQAVDAIDWRRREGSHLWSYNLHYFDFALDLAWAWKLTGDAAFVRQFETLTTSWMDAMERPGGDGWDPYVISVRGVNWVYAIALLESVLGASLLERLWESLGAQMAVLNQRVEYDLGANHLARNRRAQAVLGFAMAGPLAARTFAAGVGGLWGALEEQVLPDGGHFERSPMYHAIVLGDCLEVHDLCRAAGIAVPTRVRSVLGAMVHAMGILTRPNGDVHFFNDSSNGVALPLEHLRKLAMRSVGGAITPSEGSFALPLTGYYGYADSRCAERILVDCGEPGPSHQPGHVHCDLLSYELDLGGRRVIVNSGTSGYAGDPLREYQRSTRAHNTVTIDGKEQSEVWGVFRVARRAQVVSAASSGHDGSWAFRGEYRPFHANGSHHRSITRLAPCRWRVEDRVTGAAGSILRSYIHFHPDFEVVSSGGLITATATGGTTLTVTPFGVDAVSVTSGWFSPEFGMSVAACVVELAVHENDGRQFGYVLSADERR